MTLPISRNLCEFSQVCFIREPLRVTTNYERANVPELLLCRLDDFCEVGCTVTQVVRKSVSFSRQTEKLIVYPVFCVTKPGM